MNPLNRLVGEVIEIDERRYQITDYELVNQNVLLHAPLDESTGILYVSLAQAPEARFSVEGIPIEGLAARAAPFCGIPGVLPDFMVIIGALRGHPAESL